MLFGSVCSGIEAASVAWHPLGWKTAYVAEIEPFPCAVLAQRIGAKEPIFLPDGVDWKSFHRIQWGDDVDNYGDFTRIIDLPDGPPSVDLLVGGTPCQAFSVAGARQSLADARGNLTLEYVRLVHASRNLRWAVWENVPGVLSTDDNAFGCFLGALVGSDDALHVPRGGRWPDAGMVAGPLGRAAWRILDAQHFGLAQRRRRVFVVFCPTGAAGDPAAILFERKSLPWDSQASGEAGEGVAGTIAGGARKRGGYSSDDIPLAAALTASEGGVSGKDAVAGRVVPTIDASFGRLQGCSGQDANHGHGHLVAHTLRGEGFDASEDGTGRGTPLVPCLPFDTTQMTSAANRSNPQVGDPCHPLAAGAHAPAVAYSIMPQNSGKDFKAREVDVAQPIMAAGPTTGNQGGDYVQQPSGVRRLTPTECERLQGFPDGHTDIPWKGKPAPDGPRYKGLGNSMATTVMSWVGQRIAAYEAGALDQWRFDWSLLPWVRTGHTGHGVAVDTYNQAIGDTAHTIRSGAGPDGVPAVMA